MSNPDILNAKSRLALIRVKVERAKKHLAELEAEVASTAGQNLYVFCMKADPETGKVSPYHGPLPISSFTMLAAAGDVVQNLRSALDHLAYHLAQVGTPDREPSHYVSFPISLSAKIYESRKARKVHGMREDAKKAIDRLQPYKGGNDALWLLQELNNIDKHRFLLTVGRDHLFTGDWFEGGYLLQIANPLFARFTESQTEENLQLPGKKTVNEARVISSESLIPTLHQLVVFVDDLIGNFKPLLE